MPNVAIQVEDLGKEYRIGTSTSSAYGYTSLRDVLMEAARRPLELFRRKRRVEPGEGSDRIWALKGVNLTVDEGEVIGIIGGNGAGKSTLLKVLARITEPTEGTARIRGRIVSLLEVGTGFHPELTGRENVYLNGAIHGMRKSEIRRKFDEIVDFSGVETFIDTPVKRYSSGMYVRLAFSVAAHLDPEILLVDEVLAVGDVEFRKKCLGKMQGGTREGRTVVFVSHNMSAIRNLCQRVIVLERGELVLDATPESAIARYLDQDLTSDATINAKEIESQQEGVVRKGAPTIRLLEVALVGQDGQARNTFRSDEDILIRVTHENVVSTTDLRVIVTIVDEENQPVLGTQNSDCSASSTYHLEPGVYESSCLIPSNTFGGKRAYVSVQLVHPKVEHLILKKVLRLTVNFQGYNSPQETWEDTFLRPSLDWETHLVGEKSKTVEEKAIT